MQNAKKISATAILFISFLWIIMGLNKISSKQRLTRVEVPEGWSFRSHSPSKKTRYFHFPEAPKWKFKDGGYIRFSDNSVILPISKRRKIKKFKEYVWVPSTQPVVIRTNDVEFIRKLKIIPNPNEEHSEVSQ